MTMETQQHWHCVFLESLEALAGIERQRRAWLDGTDSSFPSPVELVCQLFDDSGIDDLLEIGLVFSQPTDALLRKMSSLAEEVDVEVAAEKLLQCESWRRLSQDAGRALQMVKVDLAK